MRDAECGRGEEALIRTLQSEIRDPQWWSIRMIPVSENIKSISPYVPGKPIEELERELGITGSIKLASNENPLGPSPKAVTAVKKALEGLNRYPDGSGFYLSQALSRKLGYPPEAILLGNG